MADKNHFKSIITMAAIPFDKKVTPELLKVYWMTLGEYSNEALDQALEKHLKDPQHGSFFPKPADFIRHLEGGKIGADEILAMARNPKTPLGCLARIKIGHWDLENQNEFYLKDRARECLVDLEEWRKRATAGEYTDHEISVMLKYEVNPAQPFALGVAAPADAQALLSRAEEIKQSPRHLAFIEPVPEENVKDSGLHPSVAARLEKLTD